MIPPKPEPRPDRVSLWRYARLFRSDILSAQPARLYRAWMAEFKTPFFRSYLVNQPDLVAEILRARPRDFPKSERIAEGLRPLLGQSVFLTNGADWDRQRRIIDPAFEGGRLRDVFPAMLAAADGAVDRLGRAANPVEIEAFASHAAADVILRTLFSIPIDHALAKDVFAAFRAYQRDQPILNPAAFVPLPGWIPRLHRRRTRKAARTLRRLICGLTEARRAEIARGTPPDDLATKIMTTEDPETGQRFGTGEMVDQVAIFFLAGHETSAAALSWALYLLARDPAWQERVANEVRGVTDWNMTAVAGLNATRNVFREALRLYPPVPMMVRESTHRECFRDREIPKGAQFVISPWHLHRHERLWESPDTFDPARWETEAGRESAREAFLPFSAGPRVCPGAGFAMIEGSLLLGRLIAAFKFETVVDREPVPVAHLTVRSRDGIWLCANRR
ncbi:MAG: cytochrome P450 [Marinibacterium sp.]